MRLFPLTLLLASILPAQQALDADFAKSVKEWTTKPEFSSRLVDHLPKSATVPSPKDILGHHIGAPKKLTYYAELLSYYRLLAAKSVRVKIVDIGKTDEGRDSIVVFLAARGENSCFDVRVTEMRTRSGMIERRHYLPIGYS